MTEDPFSQSLMQLWNQRVLEMTTRLVQPTSISQKTIAPFSNLQSACGNGEHLLWVNLYEVPNLKHLSADAQVSPGSVSHHYAALRLFTASFVLWQSHNIRGWMLHIRLTNICEKLL